MYLGECLHEVFAECARKDGARVAVRAGAEQVTYGELDARATALAARLRGAGIGPDMLVGLCVDRSVELVVGMLGILKAGAAYLPVDPTYPAARIRFLLEDAAVPVVVSVPRVHLPETGAQVIPVSDDIGGGDIPIGGDVAAAPYHAASGVGRHHLAYAIYTSGSTGEPKGVLVEHGNVLRLFEQTAPWFGFDDRDVWSVCHSASFDFSVWEIWGGLLHGGQVVIAPYEVARNPARLFRWARTENVTVLNQTPSAFRSLIAADRGTDGPPAPPLRLVILGGERLDPGMVRPWIDRYGDERPELVNMYGITETTVHVTYRRIRRADLAHPELSPIGVPIPDLSLRVVDAAGRPVPDGAAGELEVAGPGLARGYLHRPELTAARFVRAPDGRRWYRSGDRGMRQPDGEFRYLGRTDTQLKIRGFRVEPAEVEACLARHPAVATAIATARDFGDGDVRLIAYVVPGPGNGDAAGSLVSELDALAAGELPAHLRPSAIHLVDEVPMTTQGKADLATLAGLDRPPAAADPGTPADPDTPADAVSAIVATVLGLEDTLAPDVDLFEAGATSLAFVRIITAVNEHFDLTLTGAELGDTATVTALSECVTGQLRGAGPAEPTAIHT